MSRLADHSDYSVLRRYRRRVGQTPPCGSRAATRKAGNQAVDLG